jgi:biopolymer transport protein ExbD
MSDHKKGLGGLFGKDSQTTYDVYLNLTPLMDVMSNILFFLLAAFGASAVAILSVTVPVDASSDASTDPPEDKVTVTMRADATGITLGCQDPVKTPDELKVCDHRLPKRGTNYDTPGLVVALKDIKQRFPGSNTIMFVPDDDLHYETIVKILDAARDIKQPDGRRLPLYPDVVMSSLVK